MTPPKVKLFFIFYHSLDEVLRSDCLFIWKLNMRGIPTAPPYSPTDTGLMIGNGVCKGETGTETKKTAEAVIYSNCGDNQRENLPPTTHAY
jgi:hypothetical protein